MFRHSLTHNCLVSLLVAFVTVACSSTANTPPPSPSSIVLATLPAKLTPPTVLPTAGLAAMAATETASPAVEPIQFPGYQNIEFLPDNILLTSQPAPANVIQSLAISGIGGFPCGGETVPAAYINGSHIRLCAYPPGEQVTIELRGPDGSSFSVTVQPEYYPEEGMTWLPYCFDDVLLLLPGLYQVKVKSTARSQTGSFMVNDVTRPTVFLSQSIALLNQCIGHILQGEPILIFYAGFLPSEVVQVILYGESQVGSLAYITSWTATMDEAGRSVQHIEAPQLPGEGDYVVVALGHERHEIDTSELVDPNGHPIKIEASAIARFLGSKAQAESPRSPPTPAVVSVGHLRQLIHVAGGDFAMGSTPGDPFSEPIERPQHIVYISDFWIEQTEVSNAKYAACVAAGGCTRLQTIASKTRLDYYTNLAYADYPVINVTYEQAVSYCRWAGGRLPTEAEWEKAARGSEGRLYPWGNSPPSRDIANYGKILGDTTPVSAYRATPLGVLNMAGNAWEWVSDWFGPTYHTSSPDRDPAGPATGTERVVRGGSWGSDPQFLRTTNRYSRNPAKGYDSVGFRCVTTTAP